jgi:nucleotide-binding universal stress UspA family protein
VAAWKKICCPIDFTWESRIAMEEAAELAWRFGSQLTLVHVVPRGRPDAEATASVEPSEAGLQPKLAEWLNEADRIAANGVDSAVRAGAPADEIVRFAREGRYDVIVMGTRADAARDHSRAGSVAQAVVATAPCTVVVARGRPYREHQRQER